MRRLIRWLSLFSVLFISCWGLLGWMQPVTAVPISLQPTTVLAAQTELAGSSDEAICPELSQKIDLNNANIVAFKDCKGFYPSLARLIINNGPYQKVEDVLAIPELSDHQKQLLKSQLKNFTITEAKIPVDMRMPPRPMMR